LTTTGEKLILLAEIIRVSTKGATEASIADELSLSADQTIGYVSFLKSRRLLVLVGGREYFPTTKGLSYLSTYDEAANLVDIDGPDAYYSGAKTSGLHKSIYWDKGEILSRMREIIEP
jgi:hypothetical protein